MFKDEVRALLSVVRLELITNSGPGLAQGVEANVTIPSGLNPVSAATTLGSPQITGNNFHLAVNQLAPEEAVSSSITTTNLNAQGTITTTATLTASTADPVQSNNSASITGLFTAAPTPTPTPIPTPTHSNSHAYANANSNTER